MKFSIIIPAYNAEASLERTLDSIGNQTNNDYEIILVNDGSIDRTGDLCKRFCKTHNNARYIEQDNKGVFEARREGARASMGDYLIFVDADDCLRADALALLADKINQLHPDVICFCYTRNKDYSKDPYLTPSLPIGFYSDDSLIEVETGLAQGRLNSIWGKAIKKRCIEQDLNNYSCQRIDFAEDLLQVIPIIEKTQSLLQVDDALYFYNDQNAQSATHKYKEKQLIDLRYVTALLIQKAASWGDALEEDSLRMRTAQYLYLLLINELTSSRENRKANFIAICRDLFSLEDRAIPPHDPKRPDIYLLYLAAKHKSYEMARIVIRGSEFAKNLIRPVISHIAHK